MTAGRFPEATFVRSAASHRDFPREGLPEVVLAGRSNVGKSSLINRLVGQKDLARTSSTPGKTQTINFYRLSLAHRSFFLVDLPGYGYARVAKHVTGQWRKLIEAYFKDRSNVALVIHLVDLRIAPSRLDLELQRWLDEIGVPRLLVATKSDKLSASDQASQLRVFAETFEGGPVVAVSARTGQGCREIWKQIEQATS